MNRYPHVSVHALDTGVITMPLRFFVTPLTDKSEMTVLPSMSFLIQHRDPASKKVTRILFDLGIRVDTTQYTESMREYLLPQNTAMNPTNIHSALHRGGLSEFDIDYAIFSHLHWDHIGVPAELSRAQFILGGGGLQYLATAGVNGAYERLLFPLLRTVELHQPGSDPSATARISPLFAKPWRPMATLPHTLDIFGDGSCFIVDAPGHMPGHLNMLCRLEGGNYVYLAGDICHDRRILTGEMDMSTWPDPVYPSIMRCAHTNKSAAISTIKRVIDIEDGNTVLGKVEVVLSHDGGWLDDAKHAGRLWPGKL